MRLPQAVAPAETLTGLADKVRDDYRYDGDIMSEEQPRTRALLYIINNRLEARDRDIMLLYIDCGSYRKLGKMLDMTHSAAYQEVQKIKTKILNELYGKEK